MTTELKDRNNGWMPVSDPPNDSFWVIAYSYERPERVLQAYRETETGDWLDVNAQKIEGVVYWIPDPK